MGVDVDGITDEWHGTEVERETEEQGREERLNWTKGIVLSQLAFNLVALEDQATYIDFLDFDAMETTGGDTPKRAAGRVAALAHARTAFRVASRER